MGVCLTCLADLLLSLCLEALLGCHCTAGKLHGRTAMHHRVAGPLSVSLTQKLHLLAGKDAEPLLQLLALTSLCLEALCGQ
jgi:hypothetical protein